MSREIFLPTGMEGVILCPVQADPPALYVNWTKDGNDLNLENVRKHATKNITSCTLSVWIILYNILFQYPGWIINSEGSVFITTANDNAVGMYTCTAYNSYGTMGQSEPTQVILQVSPPAFYINMSVLGENIFSPSSFFLSRTLHLSGCVLGPSITRRWAENW